MDDKCARCDDCGWVCEEHPYRPWQGVRACDYGALARPAPTAILLMTPQRASRSQGCRSRLMTKPGGTDPPPCSPCQPPLNFFPASPDLLHRLLHCGFGAARLFCLVPDLIILSTSDAPPVLAAPAARLLRCFGHCVLLVPLQRSPEPRGSASQRNAWKMRGDRPPAISACVSRRDEKGPSDSAGAVRC